MHDTRVYNIILIVLCVFVCVLFCSVGTPFTMDILPCYVYVREQVEERRRRARTRALARDKKSIGGSGM